MITLSRTLEKLNKRVNYDACKLASITRASKRYITALGRQQSICAQTELTGFDVIQWYAVRGCKWGAGIRSGIFYFLFLYLVF